MFGKKVLLLWLILILIVKPIALIATQEADNKVLVFTAQPVDTEQFRKEWEHHAWAYPIIWSIAYGIALFK
jgi:hypothetical protein